MAKNCKTYPSDHSITGAVVPTIFGTIALVMFLPDFKHRAKIILIAAILICIAGYKIGKGVKTTVEICE